MKKDETVSATAGSATRTAEYTYTPNDIAGFLLAQASRLDAGKDDDLGFTLSAAAHLLVALDGVNKEMSRMLGIAEGNPDLCVTVPHFLGASSIREASKAVYEK